MLENLVKVVNDSLKELEEKPELLHNVTAKLLNKSYDQVIEDPKDVEFIHSVVWPFLPKQFRKCHACLSADNTHNEDEKKGK